MAVLETINQSIGPGILERRLKLQKEGEVHIIEARGLPLIYSHSFSSLITHILNPAGTAGLPGHLIWQHVQASDTARDRAKQRPPEYTGPITHFTPFAFNITTAGPDSAATRICNTQWYARAF